MVARDAIARGNRQTKSLGKLSALALRVAYGMKKTSHRKPHGISAARLAGENKLKNGGQITRANVYCGEKHRISVNHHHLTRARSRNLRSMLRHLALSYHSLSWHQTSINLYQRRGVNKRA